MIVYEYMLRQGLTKVTSWSEPISCVKAEMFAVITDEMAKLQEEESKKRRRK